MARMNITLSDPVYEALMRLVPPRQRSQFIGKAVREKLERLRQEESARLSAGSWSSDGRGDVETEIRKLREGWATRMENGAGTESDHG
ncbi:MAG: hypothetical protein JW797_05590 [Bradymonadales bacterium]|nr:hypothetical protein [Bradymonadales bacterium]